MPTPVALTLLALVGGYLVVGIAFAILFVAFGVERVQPKAAASGWGFRALILPGSAVFWPYLCSRWIKSSPGVEEDE